MQPAIWGSPDSFWLLPVIPTALAFWRYGDKIHFLVEHTVTSEEAEKLIKMLTEEFDCAEVLSCDTQPVAALKIGPKSIGLSFYSD